MQVLRTATLITISAVLVGCATQSPPNQPIDPPGLFEFAGFHHVMVTTRDKTVYVAGQVSQDEDWNVVGEGDYRAQTIRALQNVAIALEAAGAGPEDVVSSTFYIKGLRPEVAAAVMEGMGEALDGEPFPAHAFNLIGVEALAEPRLLIEITAIATVD